MAPPGKKPKTSRSASRGRGRQARAAAARDAERSIGLRGTESDDGHGFLVGATIAAAVVAVVIGVAALTPLIIAAPMVFVALRTEVPGTNLRARLVRWFLTAVLSIGVLSVFVGERAVASLPFSTAMSQQLTRWLAAGETGDPVSALILAGAFVVAVGGSLVSRGVIGVIVLGVGACAVALHATVVYGDAHNIIQITLVAITPWTLATTAALMIAIPESAAASRKVLGGATGGPDWTQLRHPAMVCAGLIVVAVLLRLLVAAPYAALVRRWTLM